MPNSKDVLQVVRELTAELLNLELDEVQAESLFFEDLAGESIDLIELSFHIDKRYSVRLKFQELIGGDIQLDERNFLTAESLAKLKTKFPFLKLDRFATEPIRRATEILTIEAIAGFVDQALAAKPQSV